MSGSYDAVVVGAGPNGLSAAVELARSGLSVCVLEAAPRIGGGTRTLEVTEPGFRHDICSAIHPMGIVSPFFRAIELERWGLQWVPPEIALAHPLDDGPSALFWTSLERTIASLPQRDREGYRRLMEPLVQRAEMLLDGMLRPIRIPRHALAMARFGRHAVRSCVAVADSRFRSDMARALFAGACAHSVMPLDRAGTAAFGMALMLAGHVAGWPLARGGSQAIADALEACLRSHGGEIRTGIRVTSLADLPECRAVLFDLSPRQIARIAGSELPSRYRRSLERFRHGPGSFKIDWALSGPIPWKDEALHRAGTVHLGGTLEEIAAGEAAAWRGEHSDNPFVLIAQQSHFDTGRAPEGMHTGWGYCHVPHGSTRDMTGIVERQVERFAPGFRDVIVARSARTARDLEAYNPTMVGGDIGGGANTLWQLLARPAPRLDPYSTPNPRFFVCSSSTPPGGGVHGMCGYLAARSALRRRF
jgi:phytoene dehydrogenase-like protein